MQQVSIRGCVLAAIVLMLTIPDVFNASRGKNQGLLSLENWLATANLQVCSSLFQEITCTNNVLLHYWYEKVRRLVKSQTLTCI